MITEFQTIFRAIGWENFWHITEEGSRELTIEFLCTLQTNANNVVFRLFGQQYTITWKQFSTLLGFNQGCYLELNGACEDFDRLGFWKEIASSSDASLPRTNNIHNPTLRFMHRWLAMTLFPRLDIHTIRVDEMKLLYAMINRIHVSPIKCMLEYWLGIFRRGGDVECTSLITRIARNLGLLDTALINYISTNRPTLEFDHFIHAHIMRIENGSLIMTYLIMLMRFLCTTWNIGCIMWTS